MATNDKYRHLQYNVIHAFHVFELWIKDKYSSKTRV